MDQHSTDVISGTLDMLILKTLSLAPMHGFGIGRWSRSRAAYSRSTRIATRRVAAARTRRLARRRVA
jgi:hypothetical protein